MAQRVLIADIIARVAKDYGLTVALLTGASQCTIAREARHFAMWRAWMETGKPFSEIGNAFGHCGHDTARKAILREHARQRAKQAAE